jgi:exopolysaccharide production protein ExoY
MGDMSIVGPRPIVREEMIRYGRYFVEYCRVRPGITGLWQVSGRSDTSYRRRVALDVTYVRSKSFALDVKIILLTIPCVLAVRGSR